MCAKVTLGGSHPLDILRFIVVMRTCDHLWADNLALLPLLLSNVCNVECRHEGLLLPLTQLDTLNVLSDGLLILLKGPAARGELGVQV